MCSYLVDDNSEHKKAKSMNRNILATISHSEYKDLLLHKKCLRHSMNMIHDKDHNIGAYDNEIYGLIMKYRSKQWMRWIRFWLPELIIKNSYLNNY